MNEIDTSYPKYEGDHSQYYSHKISERHSERPSVSNDAYASNTKSENLMPFPMDSKRSTEKRSYRKDPVFEEKYSSCKHQIIFLIL